MIPTTHQLLHSHPHLHSTAHIPTFTMKFLKKIGTRSSNREISPNPSASVNREITHNAPSSNDQGLTDALEPPPPYISGGDGETSSLYKDPGDEKRPSWSKDRGGAGELNSEASSSLYPPRPTHIPHPYGFYSEIQHTDEPPPGYSPAKFATDAGLKGEEELKVLGEYDTVIIVDDSGSMQSLWTEVGDTFSSVHIESITDSRRLLL